MVPGEMNVRFYQGHTQEFFFIRAYLFKQKLGFIKAEVLAM
jgi:hypothetical protein